MGHSIILVGKQSAIDECILREIRTKAETKCIQIKYRAQGLIIFERSISLSAWLNHWHVLDGKSLTSQIFTELCVSAYMTDVTGQK